MKIAIRVDASLIIGAGHVFRCLTLAKELKNQGHDVSFYSRPQAGDLISLVKNSGFDVVELKSDIEFRNPCHSSDYETWLQIPWVEDAIDFLNLVGEVDLVIVDHYGIGKLWEKKVKQTLGCKLFVIDDIERAHEADFLLDQTYNTDQAKYESSNVKHLLLGTDFALIKPEFSKLRLQIDKNSSLHIDNKVKVLVSMGAMDLLNTSIRIIKSLKNLPKNYSYTVIVSRNSETYEDVVDFCKVHKNFHHLDFVEDMPNCMSSHNLAIGAPGATSWERACLGIPAVLIPLADNQLEIGKVLSECGSAKLVHYRDIEENLVSALSCLINDYDSFRKNSLKVCDGLGVKRTLGLINQEFQIG